ncbi:transposase [Neorhizobium galegae]|nr:transposase [Neorhizobium galegae]
MSKSNFSEEFKRDAVRQITERGYPVSEVSQRLGVSQHSLYEWKKTFAASNAKGNDEVEEIRRLKKELARVTEERDILKKAAVLMAVWRRKPKDKVLIYSDQG